MISDFAENVYDACWTDAWYIGRVETVILMAPVVVWGAGASEGAVRTAIAAGRVFLFLGDRKERENFWSQFNVTKGCVVLVGVTMLPLLIKAVPYARYILRIPFYYATEQAYEVIYKQVGRYSQLTRALKRVEERIVFSDAEKLAKELVGSGKDPKRLQELFQETKKQIVSGVTVTAEDLSDAERQIRGSLIGRNMCYTAAYTAVDFSARQIAKATYNSYLLVMKIVESDMVRSTVKFTYNSLKNEVISTAVRVEIPSEVS